ncbi:MAG: GNAT family N-acetyltransferase [Planctomycetes bacterium]|nr:GNAT family N-acetyltransferase [Planctomycetota bacterium]
MSKTSGRRPKVPRVPKVQVRHATPADVPEIFEVQRAAYEGFPTQGLCDERLLGLQVNAFPEGQLVAVRGERVVGYATSLIVSLDDDSPWYSYNEITGNGTFSTHDPSGDTLYGADIAVHPDARGQGVAGKLYQGRRRILTRFNLRRMVAGGRIPGYVEVAGRLSPEDYVEEVVRGERSDQALNAHLKAGYRVLGVYHGYLHDEQSLDFATFLELENPRFKAERRRIAASPIHRPVRRVRVCAVQYEMRPIESWEEFVAQVGFFVAAADANHCHFLVFPELFTVQLLRTLPEDADHRAGSARLAELTERYRELFRGIARRTGMLVLAGSQPTVVDGELRNVAHLFTPSGNVYTQDKLHVSPDERRLQGVIPGTGVQVFDTGFARIAIVVSYDIEFPELVRLLTLAGAEVIFCPYSTDERKSYMRIRYCAHARAVENCVYVVLAGNVGNLPDVENFLMNYGQAAVLTPSDFAFPLDGIAAVADSNSETVVITDLDLSALEQYRQIGSVRPLQDRRPDLYRLESLTGVEVVRTV